MVKRILQFCKRMFELFESEHERNYCKYSNGYSSYKK